MRTHDAAEWSARRAGTTGQPLSGFQRQRAERFLHQDLSGVRIHPGAADVGARGSLAETVGDDVAFAPGMYRPGTPAGDLLLAHELAHTAQQDANRTDMLPVQVAERDAHRASVGLAAALVGGSDGGVAPPRARGGLQVSRCDPEDAPKAGGRGVHYDEAMTYEAAPPTDVWKQAFGGDFTEFMDPDKSDVLEHLEAMNAGGAYVFFGHGGQDSSGTTLGINADDHTVMGDEIQEALSRDGSPPTLVVLGGCSTRDIESSVTDAGVPVFAGLSEDVSNAAGAGAIRIFMDALAQGETFGDAHSAANEMLTGASSLLNRSGARIVVRYGAGYDSGMTLAEARRRHQTAP